MPWIKQYARRCVTGDVVSANNLPMTAIAEPIDLRGAPSVRAGTYPFDADDVVTDWHTHDTHQIEYAFQGVVEVQTRHARYLLPPQQALWIPAGVVHRTTLRRVRTVSVFFDPALTPPAGDRVRVLPVVPLMREMIVFASRWPITRTDDDPLADVFFDALAQLTMEWLEHEARLYLPASSDPVIASAMAFTDSHLKGVLMRDVARAVDVSERTLRRTFVAATGITWREYLRRSRLLRAMALLAEAGPTVLDVSTHVGFDSVSAFTRAFVIQSGETPSGYRRRVLQP
jgi:AraC-like DNA-binding protein